MKTTKQIRGWWLLGCSLLASWMITTWWNDDAALEVSDGLQRAGPLARRDWIRDATYEREDDVWVAVGRFGRIFTSSTGNYWNKIYETADGGWLYGLTYGNNLWFAVGDGGIVVRSENGTEWDESASLTVEWLASVAYGNGQYIAVGSAGTIYANQLGNRWKPVESGVEVSLDDIHYNFFQWVAVGENGTIIGSEDGLSWQLFETPPQVSELRLDGIYYGDGLWVAVGERGTILISEGEVPTVWERIGSGTNQWLDDVFYAKGLWVVVGSQSQLLTSSDALMWSSHSNGKPPWISAVTYGDRWVALGEERSQYYSWDGEDWEFQQ